MILSKLSEFQQRLVMSTVSILVVLLAIALSHLFWFKPVFLLLTTAAIVIALHEYYRIAMEKNYHPLVKVGVIGSIAYLFAIFLNTQSKQPYILPEIILGVTLTAGFCYYFIKGSDPFVNLALTFFGIIYLTIPLSCLITINYFEDGRWALFYLLLVTKMTDTSAFFIGKWIGKRKLSPYISPKKTWEGACGGLLGAILSSIAIYLFFSFALMEKPFVLTFTQSIWFAACLSVAAQFGDLAESLLKRDVGVKDSSDIPGLGGLLDILDSLVFTSPLMLLFLKISVR